MAVTNEKKLKNAYEAIEREIVKNDEVVKDVISPELQKKIITQVEEEYQVAYSYNEAKRKVMLQRLKLYNNQRRESKAVGDPLMFTVFNTVHAALYDDRLMASWEGRGGQGDEDIEENLNALAEFDYDVMQKSELDYQWNWDAEFFGRGLLLCMDFDRSEGVMAPMPEVIDAVSWIRDPRATSVNGDVRGHGAMRFGGREVGATYYELKGLPGYFNLGSLRKDKDIKSTMDDAREARREAQGLEHFTEKEESLGKYNNYEFRLLDWFTTIKGKKYLVTLGNNRSTLIRMIDLSKYGDRWPIIDRVLYPMAHDWDGVSIPDLTEDKQRARAVLLNIGLESAKSDVTPTYLYDRTRIKNKNDLNFRINKFVGVDGQVDNAIQPVQKATAHQYVNLIMDILDQGAQRATATPEIQQGIPQATQRTLGELELVSSKVDTRYSMSAKVYGWSEAHFWRQWYKLYKVHFKDKIDEKVIRIQGALAPIWRPLSRENVISHVDPDVKIESKVISEAKRLREQQSFAQFAGLAIQDPENNRRFIFKKLGKLQGLPKEEIDMMFPQTVDEIQAEEENILLNEGKPAKIAIEDDHKVHIDIHAKADQNPRTLAHVRQHKQLMVLKRNRPDLFPPEGQQQVQQPGQPGGQGQPGQAPAPGSRQPSPPPPTTPTQ